MRKFMFATRIHTLFNSLIVRLMQQITGSASRDAGLNLHLYQSLPQTSKFDKNVMP
jgi:hypothetical protein